MFERFLKGFLVKESVIPLMQMLFHYIIFVMFVHVIYVSILLMMTFSSFVLVDKNRRLKEYYEYREFWNGLREDVYKNVFCDGRQLL